MPHNATKLLVDASDAGLHITGLDGWTQTRLAKTLQIRRETLNGIINRSPGSEPTDERPRMVEACRKLITFAAALSAKDDVILKNPIDLANLQSDDGQAYEHHRLRLHRLVEEAVESNQFTNALCRLGEFASAALHASEGYRLRMICNLMTAIQRLLDKPASREVPLAVLRTNLSRLYRVERTARRIGRQFGRAGTLNSSTREQLDYVRGQAGYALVFTGMLMMQPKLVQRGGRRLFHAVAVQPASSCGHWSNLLRATNDLLAGFPSEATNWADRLLSLAESQAGEGFATAYNVLKSKSEIQRLRSHWAQGESKATVDRLLQNASHKAQPDSACACRNLAKGVAIVLLAFTALATLPAFAGDGRDFKSNQSDPGNQPRAQLQPATPPLVTRPQNLNGTPNSPTAGTPARPATNGTRPITRLGLPGRFRVDPTDPTAKDAEPAIASNTADAANDDAVLARAIEDAWGDNIKSYVRAAGPASAKVTILLPKPTQERSPEKAITTPAPKPALASTDPVEKAARALGMAKNYVSVGDETVARRKLREIVKAYPETPAAQQAQAMLEQLASN